MAFKTRGAPIPIVKPDLHLSERLDIIIEKQHFWKLHHWASPGCFLYLHALWTWMWTCKLATWTWNCILGEFFWREIPLFSNKRRYWKVGVIQKKSGDVRPPGQRQVFGYIFFLTIQLFLTISIQLFSRQVNQFIINSDINHQKAELFNRAVWCDIKVKLFS